jgi:RNA polymerase sigma factor (sigma-70 family)
MKNPRKHDSLYRKGPEEVIPWLQVTRDSPVELDRKFGYIVTHHTMLASAEKKLGEVTKAGKCKSVIRTQKEKVANNKAWLTFSVQTLTNHVRHAMARCSPNSEDGILLREHGNQRKRYGSDKPLRFRKPRKAAQKKIRYYATILEEYKLAKAACAGHSGSNDALLGLIQHAQSVIQNFTNSTFKEKEDAKQLAIMSLLKTAKAFNASHKSMARFNTYAWWKARKSVECRATRDCKPGIAIVPDEDGPKGQKKLVSVASINAAPKGKEAARDVYHPATVTSDEGCRMDVARALGELEEMERLAVVGVLMENKSLRQISRESGISARRLRDALERGRVTLRRLLADFE